MVKINLNISNRSFILISFLLIIIIGGGIVIAYNSAGNPALFGHSLNEIALPACTTGQSIVKQSDGSWGCGNSGNSFNFINTVSVYSTTSAVASIPYTAFDASNYVPVGTKYVILQVIAGSTQGSNSVWIKSSPTATAQYILLSQASMGTADTSATGSQGIYPLGSDRKFYYTVDSWGGGSLNDLRIELIGYVI